MCQDFEELLASFHSRSVRYLIGGAHALALHGRPRATKDLDLFLDPTRSNAQRTVRALGDFFGGSAPSYVSVEALIDRTTIVQLGVAPIRVDLISTFGTLTFREAWASRVDACFGKVPAHFLSKAHLIAEKQFFNRPQDRADVLALQGRPDKTRVRSRKTRRV